MLTITNLTKQFAGKTLSWPDMQAQSGECLWVHGNSGSGKTTLCEIIAGFMQPTTGLVGVGFQSTRSDFHHLHYLSQFPEHNLIGPTVREDLQLWGLADGSLTDTDIDNILAEYNLTAQADTPVWKLSFGQKKALSFCALTQVPRNIWLLDEPFAGLDAPATQRLQTHITAHLQNGGIVMATSHEPPALSFTSSIKLITIALIFLLSSLTLFATDTTPKERRYDLDEIRIVADAPVESAGKKDVIILTDTPKQYESTLTDLLQNVTGLDISTGSKGESNLKLRGFNRENVKIMIDGREINSGYFGFTSLSEMPMFDIEEVHILKGAVSPLYGVNSSGGVVNFVTRRPDSDSWLTLRTSFKRNNTHNLQAIFAHKYDLWDFWLNMSWFNTDGFMLSGNFTPTPLENGAVRNLASNSSIDYQLKTNFTLWDVHSLGLSGSYTYIDEKSVPSSIYEPSFRKFTDWKRYHLASVGSFEVNPYIKLMPQVKYDAFDNTLDEYRNATLQNVTLHSVIESWAFNAENKTEIILSAVDKLYHNYTFERETYNRKDNSTYQEWTTNTTNLHNTSIMYTRQVSTSVLSSLCLGRSLSERLYKEAPGDLHRKSKTTDWFTEGSLSVQYDDKVNSVGFAASRNIQYPYMRQLYSESRGNLNLLPENALKFEVNMGRVVSYPNGLSKVEATAFYNIISDMIIYKRKYENQGGRVRNAGAEFSLSNSVWRFDTDHRIGYIDTNMNKGFVYYELPQWKVGNSVVYRATDSLSLTYSVNWTGEMTSSNFDHNRNYILSGRTLHDASLAYKYKRGKVMFAITNIFDLDYQEEWGYPAGGRNFSVNLEYIVF